MRRLRVRSARSHGEPEAEGRVCPAAILGDSGVTAKQREVYRFMVDFQNEMGSPPTLREIGAALGIHFSTAHVHVRNLEELGHVESRRVERTITETRYFPRELAEAA